MKFKQYRLILIVSNLNQKPCSICFVAWYTYLLSHSVGVHLQCKRMEHTAKQDEPWFNGKTVLYVCILLLMFFVATTEKEWDEREKSIIIINTKIINLRYFLTFNL